MASRPCGPGCTVAQAARSLGPPQSVRGDPTRSPSEACPEPAEGTVSNHLSQHPGSPSGPQPARNRHPGVRSRDPVFRFPRAHPQFAVSLSARPLKPTRAETNSASRGPDTQARLRLSRSMPRSRMMARIVPVRRSLPPQFGIVVRVPFAGFRQISCEPRDWRSNSQPSDLNLRVNSR